VCLPQVIKSFQNYRGVATTFYPTLVEKHGNRVIGHEFTISDFNVQYWRRQKDALIQTKNKSRKALQGVKS
jgi:hypothetical protein